MRSVFVYTTIFSFAIGIVWQDIFELNTAFVVFLLIIGVAIILILQNTKKDSTNNTYIIILIIVIFASTLGATRMQIAQQKAYVFNTAFSNDVGETIELDGIIIDEPDKREYNTNLIVRFDDVGKVLVRASPYQEFNYGDEVSIKGLLERPRNFSDDNGQEFNYIRFLEKDGIHYIITRAQVDIISTGNSTKIRELLFNIKKRYIDTLNELIPDPQAALAGGITVGARRSLGSELTEAFRNTGLIHIVVLSGFNITIIILFLMRALALLPRFIMYGFIVVAIILFAVLTGADAPVVRASAMGILGVLALTLGKKYIITRALLIVAFAMIVWNPYILLNDIAFQLSFVATLGLIYIAPHIIKYLPISIPIWLREIIGATLAAQISVMPLLIYYMGKVSVVAIVVNVLVLPIIPIAMLVAFLTGTIGMLSTILATPFAYMTYLILAYVIWIVEVFNDLPFTIITF